MPNLHVPFRATRLAAGAIAALALVAATAAGAASTPITSAQFTPGWQAHAKPLIDMGFSTLPNRNRWRVPASLPRGDYVLVQRTGDTAEVIDGYRFNVSGATADQFIFLMPGLSEVEAIPVSDVPSLRQGGGAAWVR